MEKKERIGDKLYKGYNLMKEGKAEGVYEYYTAVAHMSMLDEIDEQIFIPLKKYISVINLENDLEPDMWLKALLLDKRYANVMYAGGNLINNLRKYLDLLPVIENNEIVDKFIDGEIEKLKYADNAYFYIKVNKGLRFLVRVDYEEGNYTEKPLDFDVADFCVNRKENRIEFTYIRGNKSVMAIDYDGSDKRTIKG